MELKPYPEYKDSGVEWIGEIPESWDIFKLKHVVNEFVSGGTPSSDNEKFWSQDDNDGIPWVAIGDMSNREFVNETNKKITVEGLADKKLRILKKGTILYSIFASLGKVSILNINATTNQAILGLILSKKIYNSYLKYYLKFLEEPIIALSNANTQNNLNSTIVKNISMSLPENVTQQEQIASFLDKKTSKIDKTIEKDTQLIELLKEKRAALINHVVTKGLDVDAKMKDSGVEWIGEIPEGWEIKKLKLISKIVLGKMLTPSDKGNYYLKPYLRAQNILWEYVNTDEIKEMWFSKNELNTYKLQEDDLLVSEGGEVGRTAIWKNELEECYIQNSVHKVTLNEGNVPRYFLYAFETCGKSNFFLGIVNRVSIAHLTREKLKEISFPVPNIEEQDQIAKYLDEKTQKMDLTISKIQNKINLLEEYKKSLIHHAVTGKIDVRGHESLKQIHQKKDSKKTSSTI